MLQISCLFTCKLSEVILNSLFESQKHPCNVMCLKYWSIFLCHVSLPPLVHNATS